MNDPHATSQLLRDISELELLEVVEATGHLASAEDHPRVQKLHDLLELDRALTGGHRTTTDNVKYLANINEQISELKYELLSTPEIMYLHIGSVFGAKGTEAPSVQEDTPKMVENPQNIAGISAISPYSKH